MECHVLALPLPALGDINPVLDLCRSVVSLSEDVHFTFAVTDEWLDAVPLHRRVAVALLEDARVPSLAKGGDFHGFLEAVLTKMEGPLEKLLDRLESPPSLLIAHTFMLAPAVSVGRRRNIPVVALWPTSAALFTLHHHFHLFEQNGHYISLDSYGAKDVTVDYVPGLSPTSFREILGSFGDLSSFLLPKFLETFSLASRTQCVLISSYYELEPQAFDALETAITVPLLAVASPANNVAHQSTGPDEQDYVKWLDDQPVNSVLYIAFGSHVPVSPQQMDEVAAGLRKTGVNFLLVARSGAHDELREACGDKGFVVPWCDQVRVLSHRSVGGFWSHCGWNSIKEGVFAGLPFLTFPVFGDQILNSKLIVEDWRIGLKVKEKLDDALVGRDRVARVVKKLMDSNDIESMGMRKRAKEMQDRVLDAVGENGSYAKNIDSFVKIIHSLAL